MVQHDDDDDTVLPMNKYISVKQDFISCETLKLFNQKYYKWSKINAQMMYMHSISFLVKEFGHE